MNNNSTSTNNFEDDDENDSDGDSSEDEDDNHPDEVDSTAEDEEDSEMSTTSPTRGAAPVLVVGAAAASKNDEGETSYDHVTTDSSSRRQLTRTYAGNISTILRTSTNSNDIRNNDEGDNEQITTTRQERSSLVPSSSTEALKYQEERARQYFDKPFPGKHPRNQYFRVCFNNQQSNKYKLLCPNPHEFWVKCSCCDDAYKRYIYELKKRRLTYQKHWGGNKHNQNSRRRRNDNTMDDSFSEEDDEEEDGINNQNKKEVTIETPPPPKVYNYDKYPKPIPKPNIFQTSSKVLDRHLLNCHYFDQQTYFTWKSTAQRLKDGLFNLEPHERQRLQTNIQEQKDGMFINNNNHRDVKRNSDKEEEQDAAVTEHQEEEGNDTTKSFEEAEDDEDENGNNNSNKSSSTSPNNNGRKRRRISSSSNATNSNGGASRTSNMASSSSSAASFSKISQLIQQLPCDIELASKRIRPYIYETPLFYSQELTEMMMNRTSSKRGGGVYLKLESEQVTGSFKARGSLNKILSLPINDLMERGIVTSSTGNHAQGFARAQSIVKTAAARAGGYHDGNDDDDEMMKGIIYLPETTSEAKKASLTKYNGIELRYYGTDCVDTEIYAKEQAQKNNYIWISPYNDYDIIAGQGTVGREIFHTNPLIDIVYVTVGGGGLVSGIASYYKAINPNVEIIGCQPQTSPEMFLSVQQGHIVTLDEHLPTLSDGSAGGIEPNSITFDICRRLVDRFILVTEHEIRHAIRFMIQTHHKIVEGAAAVAIAAFMKSCQSKWFSECSRKVAIVVCGCNISSDILKDILCNKDTTQEVSL